MRFSSALMLLAAAGLAAFAGLMAQTWLEQQRQTNAPIIVEKRVETGTIVVATQSLRFGTELSASNVREIDWPASSLPAGSFASIADLLKGNKRRVVLAAIEPNEPVLKSKVTGPGQRASLSSVISPGMKAVTIRVNDVNGLAGFVLPGDRVDVMLTRIEPHPDKANRQVKFNDVLLQHVRVLGIDQIADDRTEKPTVAKAVTLEVSTSDAQKLTLASNVGSLSLALRPAGSTAMASTERLSAEDLGGSVRLASALPALVVPSAPVFSEPVSAKSAANIVDISRKVFVFRSIERTEYKVPTKKRGLDRSQF